MEPAYKQLIVEEFLDASPLDRRHYELIEGVIVAMAPPAIPHQTIAARLTAEMVRATDANRPDCSVRSQAGIAPQGLTGRNCFETDIAVACGSAQDYKGIASEPLLIVEILSPSTERDDHFVKLTAYQTIPSVMEILYIETDRVAAAVYRRQADGWDEIAGEGPEARLQLAAIGLGVPLAAIYRGVPRL